MPRLESLAGVTGEYVCTNEDIIRNTSWNWSPMTAGEIAAKTGIGQRTYTHQALEQLAAQAARAALDRAGRTPAEIGAVLCCTCTSQAPRHMPEGRQKTSAPGLASKGSRQ